MARIRTIKPEFWTSAQVADCSPTARLLFVGMWTFSDDSGVHPASARRLKMEVFPADDITAEQVGALVGELIAAGLIVEYEAEGQRFWEVTGWHHQRIDKPTRRHPRRVLAGSSGSPPRVVDESSATDWSGVEKETRVEEPRTPPLPTARDCNPRANSAGSVCVDPPSAPPIQNPMPPSGRRIARTTDADLEPWFTAACSGLRQTLTYGPRYCLPTERIVAHAAKLGLSEADVRAVAGHYRGKCKDGTPSFVKFADDIDRWRADWQASKTGGQAPRKTPEQLRASGRCSEHPGETLNSNGRCDLCDEVAALRKRLAEPMEAAQ